MTDEDLRRLFEETRQQIDSSASETRGYVDEMRRHFDVRFEDIETRFDALAEGVQLLDEKVDRGNFDIRDEMRRGFAETHAMIKFSHVELDRRVLALEHGHRTLEDKVERLEERVDRIDSSTH